MPTYVYKFVDTGETIEVQQSFSDDTLTEAAHPQTGEMMPVKKVFQPVGVTFKGSGFFKTDNRGKQSASTAGSSNGGAGSAASSSETSSGGSEKSATTSGDKTSTGSAGATGSKAASSAGSSD
jgi:predicted nucleic acid-binding Zn ribbon protein